jgi:hypothetical protein
MLACLAVLGCVPLLARADAPQLDPTILTVRSCATHRIIVQRKCNPEHCFTDAFLQSGVGKRGARTYPIQEINDHVSAFVADVEVEPSPSGCVFRLTVDEPHTGDHLFTLTVAPNRSHGGYDASKTQAPN